MAEQTAIDYESLEWKDDAAGGTPIEAAALNRMEQGIADACAGVDELRTKRLPTYVVAQDGDTATQDVYMEDILGPCLILDLATRTTYYETGGDDDGHRKAITSGADIDDLRDSLSQQQQSFGLNEGVKRFVASFYQEAPLIQFKNSEDDVWNVFLGQSGRIRIRNESQQRDIGYVQLQS